MWKTFWFEGNQAWGLIDSPEEWEKIKEYYPDTDFSKAMNHYDIKHEERYGPYFGFRRECRGNKSLVDFFKENGMEV